VPVKTKEMSKLKKNQNYLSKMKILVMNSITFKITILTAPNVKIVILNVIEFITSIFILFK